MIAFSDFMDVEYANKLYSNDEDEDIYNGNKTYEQALEFWNLEAENLLSKKWYKNNKK
jgi:hypothetical protein